MSIAALFLLVFLLAYVNGANDNIKSFATVYGSGICPYPRVIRWATAAQVAGSVASIFVAGALIEAFSGKGVIPPETIANPHFALAIAAGAVVAVGLATRLGFPISTTHSLLGGLLGAGLALAPQAIRWDVLAAVFVLPLLLSPLLAMAMASTIYPAAAYFRRRLSVEPDTRLDIPGNLLGANEAHFSLNQNRPAFATVTGANLEGALESAQGIRAGNLVDTLHLASACTLAFARGLNDTPKILGLVAAVSLVTGNLSVLLLCAVAALMAAGGFLHSRSLAETLGKRITPLNAGQGLVANAIASSLVIGASFLGLPVSTTHVSTGSIFGIGAAARQATDWKVVRQIVLAWAATLPVALAAAYLLASALALLA